MPWRFQDQRLKLQRMASCGSGSGQCSRPTAAALAEGTAVSPSRDGAMMMKMHVPSLQKKRPPTFLNL